MLRAGDGILTFYVQNCICPGPQEPRLNARLVLFSPAALLLRTDHVHGPRRDCAPSRNLVRHVCALRHPLPGRSSSRTSARPDARPNRVPTPPGVYPAPCLPSQRPSKTP